MRGKIHKQQINVKYLVKLKKNLRASPMSCWKRTRTMVRTLYLVHMFWNSVSDFLKAERALNMTVKLSVSKRKIEQNHLN